MEEERSDALEVATQANQERKAQTTNEVILKTKYLNIIYNFYKIYVRNKLLLANGQKAFPRQRSGLSDYQAAVKTTYHQWGLVFMAGVML